eukprot:6199556-Pleurochrysis_carterae.AAC.2
MPRVAGLLLVLASPGRVLIAHFTGARAEDFGASSAASLTNAAVRSARPDHTFMLLVCPWWCQMHWHIAFVCINQRDSHQHVSAQSDSVT